MENFKFMFIIFVVEIVKVDFLFIALDLVYIVGKKMYFHNLFYIF